MTTSLFLARLIGPIFVACAVGMIANPRGYRAVIDESVRSRTVIFVSGILSATAGLAVLLAHNLWVMDWRAIVTVLGWLLFIGGIFRIVWPQQVARMAASFYSSRLTLPVAGAVVGVLGLILCFYGYLR